MYFLFADLFAPGYKRPPKRPHSFDPKDAKRSKPSDRAKPWEMKNRTDKTKKFEKKGPKSDIRKNKSTIKGQFIRKKTGKQHR